MIKQVQHSAAFGITVENVCAKRTWEILTCLKSTSTNFYRLEKKKDNIRKYSAHQIKVQFRHLQYFVLCSNCVVFQDSLCALKGINVFILFFFSVFFILI